MPRPHLLYFADPMCSWCWGFSPVIQAISERFGPELPIRLIVGGLRPWTKNPMTAQERQDVRSHWKHVQEASGQPFDFAFFDRDSFVYDTEPPSRAVIVLRQQGMQSALAGLRHIQHAFYAENKDVTNIDTLASLALELGMDEALFREQFTAEAILQETRDDFALTQSAGVHGFPTLLAGKDDSNQYALVTQGFQPAPRLIPALAQWLEQIGTIPVPDTGPTCS